MTTPSDKQTDNQPALQPPDLPLPCLFCGRKALIEEFRDGDDPQPLFVATCEVCPVKTYDQFTAQEAACIWNTRASVGAATVQIPEGQWQHVGIKAGNPCVVAIKFETPEQATAFINQFAATDYIPDTRARVRDGGVAIVVNARERWLKLLANAITTAEPTLFPEKGTDIQYVISREAWDGLREIHGELAKSLYAATAPVTAPVEKGHTLRKSDKSS